MTHNYKILFCFLFACIACSLNLAAKIDAGVIAISLAPKKPCVSSGIVKVTVKNYGPDTLKYFSLNWTFNGIAQTSHSWTGSLLKDSVTTLILSTQTFYYTNYKVHASTNSPNGGTDANPLNDSLTVWFLNSPMATPKISGPANVCTGSDNIYTTTRIPGNSYAWSTTTGTIKSGATTDSVKINYTTPGIDSLKLTETNYFGCTKSSSIAIFPDTTCVWPGDANRDKIVNNYDLLNLGLAYGTSGKLRPSASLTWHSQYAPDWIDTFTNKINYKQADCNGDSTINNSDTLAFNTNYSFTHPKTYSSTQGSPSDPHLVIVLSKDSAQAGDIVRVDITYGSRTAPVSNIYGLAFSIIYPSVLVDTAMADFSSTWLSPNKLSLSKKAAPGRLDLALVRTNQQDTSGYGKLATLYFKLSSTLPQSMTPFKISFAENTQINAKSQYQPVYMQSDSMLVKQTFTGILSTASAEPTVMLFPNPANTELTFKMSNNQPYFATLNDLTGKIIVSGQSINNQDFILNTISLPEGIYFLNISTDGYVVKRKVVIQH